MSGKRVLVVDDDVDYCGVLRSLFDKLRLEAVFRHDPAAGLTALRGSRPDLVMLDVNMPKGGGKLFYQALRADPEFHELPVLVVTANPVEQSIYQELDAPPHPKTMILRKPIDLNWLSAFLATQGL